MKIHCTRGCVCDCLTVDNTDYRDLLPFKKKEVLDKIKEYLISHTLDESQLEGIMSQASYACVSPRLTEDEMTCEVFLDGKRLKDIDTNTLNVFIVEYIDALKDKLDYSDYLIWEFMKNIIGLKYKYTCDECFDSVYSGDIKL